MSCKLNSCIAWSTILVIFTTLVSQSESTHAEADGTRVLVPPPALEIISARKLKELENLPREEMDSFIKKESKRRALKFCMKQNCGKQFCKRVDKVRVSKRKNESGMYFIGFKEIKCNIPYDISPCTPTTQPLIDKNFASELTRQLQSKKSSNPKKKVRFAEEVEVQPIQTKFEERPGKAPLRRTGQLKGSPEKAPHRDSVVNREKSENPYYGGSTLKKLVPEKDLERATAEVGFRIRAEEMKTGKPLSKVELKGLRRSVAKDINEGAQFPSGNTLLSRLLAYHGQANIEPKQKEDRKLEHDRKLLQRLEKKRKVLVTEGKRLLEKQRKKNITPEEKEQLDKVRNQLDAINFLDLKKAKEAFSLLEREEILSDGLSFELKQINPNQYRQAE